VIPTVIFGRSSAVSRAPRHRLDPYSRTVGISSVE
jgi:hypothetical protein